MKRMLFVILAASLMLFLACSSDNPTEPQKAKLPTVTTAAVSAIAQTTAECGGTIVSDGGATVTARGVCWSTGLTPTVSDNKTTDGTGTGSFSSSITGLAANTPYYVRAYAANSVGTSYGSAQSFTTSAAPNTVTDIDGNVYQTVTIGTQVWMAENLKVTHYRNGVEIIYGADNWGGGNGVPRYCTGTYGMLYNWYAVADSRNIAPVGWHVATDIDWQILIDHLGGDIYVVGGKLKEAGYNHWNVPNTGATNESGFSALPSGYRYFDGIYMATGNTYAYFWSSTEKGSSWPDNGFAWNRVLFYAGSWISRTAQGKGDGLSVRCIKD